jgi:hypothetical protein
MSKMKAITKHFFLHGVGNRFFQTEYLFVNKIKELESFWLSQKLSEKEKIKGLSFSILVLLDGNSDFLKDIRIEIDKKEISYELHDIYSSLDKFSINSKPISVIDKK